MSECKYLIIGGGMTADAAVRGIRELDQRGSITVVSAESDPPYNRPPLTKGLWKGDDIDSIWRNTGEVDELDLATGHRVVELDAHARRATDAAGNVWVFEHLLLATGAKPRRVAAWSDRVIYYRTLADYRQVRAAVDQHATAVVIGGGFIGSEIAAGLAMNGSRVTMIFPEQGIGARVFPSELSANLVEYYRSKGVDVRVGTQVADVKSHGQGVRVEAGGSSIDADIAIAGLGVEPDVDLARTAGLNIDNGIVVDDHLTTSHPGIYAAGDVARYWSPQLDHRVRVEHEDNALTMGHAAGRSMAGDLERYHHLPFFYSDLFERGYEAVGDLDSRLETFADWRTPFEEGVIYYLAQGRVRGVLLWNTWGQVDHARALIAEPGPFDATRLKGRLPVE